MSYWDTSCLVKLYTPEGDSTIFTDHLRANTRCVTGDLSVLEFWATVRRKEAEGGLATGAARRVQDTLEFDIVTGAVTVKPFNPSVRRTYFEIVEQCLSQKPGLYIRTNDALHLATARLSAESEIVATDKKLREAALLIGFTVFPRPK
jgi:predicted nucleic acid-binding protein